MSDQTTPEREAFFEFAGDARLMAAEIVKHRAEVDRLQAALAEALPFLPDARNTKTSAVVAWHTAHAETIRSAAAATGREHLL